MQHDNLGLIGYGEVGKIFASGLKKQVAGVQVWDLKLDPVTAPPPVRAQEKAHADQAGVQTCASLQALCETSDFIISAVTASTGGGTGGGPPPARWRYLSGPQLGVTRRQAAGRSCHPCRRWPLR